MSSPLHPQVAGAAFDAFLRDSAPASRTHREWSPADGDFIHQCPVNALSTQTLEATEHGRRSSAERRRERERRSSGATNIDETEEVA